MPVVNLADSSTPLPDYFVVDASLLLVLRSGSRHRRQASATSFLQRVARECLAGNMVCIAPTLVLEECYFKIIQASIAGLTTTHWHRHYKSNPQVIQQCLPAITVFHQTVQALPITVVTSEDLALTQPTNTLEERMRRFISEYNLLPKDAYILAVAERLGVDDIATLDGDWRRATQFTVYTC